jgi:ribonuclease T1
MGLLVSMAGLVLLSEATQATASASGTVSMAQLPPKARAVDGLIRSGGPFKSPKDGSVFGNRERALPAKPRGFYHEYTVSTPGAHNRGARRIVCGGKPPTTPETCFYTGDHYTTFQRIVP